jgi:hypothetical protein
LIAQKASLVLNGFFLQRKSSLDYSSWQNGLMGALAKNAAAAGLERRCRDLASCLEGARLDSADCCLPV